MDVEQISQDLKAQLDRRKDNLKKMVNDVCQISNSLTSWMADFAEQKKSTLETQNKLQSSLYALDQSQRREMGASHEGSSSFFLLSNAPPARGASPAPQRPQQGV